jgi:ectoine hydroxylase-related dioxygenase (phytanoyl-CoA dioxygenase family)
MTDPTDAVTAELIETGWLVLPGLLDAGEVTRLRELLAPVLAANPRGRSDFEGRHTERVYSLLAKCPEIAALAERPRVLEIGERICDPGFLLSSVQAVNIHPGESAQALHADDFAGATPRPRAPGGFSTMWALTDFTGQSGSTRLIPGSHRFGANDVTDEAAAVSVEMPAGSVLLYMGGVEHGGGAHHGTEPRLGISILYCEPWLRQFENLTLATPPEIAARFSERVQRMLGYSLYGPMGTVDGRDPIRLLHR